MSQEMNPFELLELTEEEARERLDDDEFLRWQSVQNVEEGAQDTRRRWREQSETVRSIVIEEDMTELEASLSIYGNDLKLRIDTEEAEPRIREFIDEFGPLFEEADDEEGLDDLLDPAQQRAFKSLAVELFALMFAEFNGTDLRDVPLSDRRLVALDCLDAWGRDGMGVAIARAIIAMHEQNEGVMEDIRGFRQEAWAFNR